MENKYLRLVEDMSNIAAKLVKFMHGLPSDMKRGRGMGEVQLAYDCMALERKSLQLIDQVFPVKRNDPRSSPEAHEDPCVRAAQSLQGVFTNIARLDQVVPFWADGNSLREDISKLLRVAVTLIEKDLVQTLDARRRQVVEQLAARDWGSNQGTVEDASATGQSDPSLSILASSVEVQAAALEAMLNLKYVAQPEITPAAENPHWSQPNQRRVRAGASL